MIFCFLAMIWKVYLNLNLKTSAINLIRANEAWYQSVFARPIGAGLLEPFVTDWLKGGLSQKPLNREVAWFYTETQYELVKNETGSQEDATLWLDRE